MLEIHTGEVERHDGATATVLQLYSRLQASTLECIEP